MQSTFSELKPFLNKFEQIARVHNYSTVFEDFLNICVNFFGNGLFTKERDQGMKRYSRAEKNVFNEMFYIYVETMGKVLDDKNSIRIENHAAMGNGWYDFFGSVYEFIVLGKGKASGLGQFFTPSHICDLMTAILSPKKRETVIDPCCGSGRMLLASNAHNNKSMFYASDIDSTCCKMTAINFFMHGLTGEVIWKDALDPTDYRKGYLIRRDFLTGIPMIIPLDKEYSYIWKSDQAWIERMSAAKKVDLKKEIEIKAAGTIFENNPEELSKVVRKVEKQIKQIKQQPKSIAPPVEQASLF